MEASETTNTKLPQVSIVILHSKNVQDTIECLESLKQTTYPNYEVIVVNNNDSVDINEILIKASPRIKIITTKENLGHAEGCNVGYKASSTKSKYIAFIDNDVTFDPKWLEYMVNFCEQEKDVGACQPKLLQYQNPKMFEYNGGAGGYIDPYGYTVVRGRIFYAFEEDHGQWDNTAEVFWAGGCCVMVTRRSLEEVGLYDPDFFLYFDEIDLCWRMKLSGYRIFCVPSARIYHKGGGKRSSFALYYKHRNNIVMMIKNYSLPSLLTYLPGRVLMDFLAIPLNGTSVMRAYIWIIKNILPLSRKRKAVQQLRRITDKDLKPFMILQSIVMLYYIRKCKSFKQVLSSNPHLLQTFRSK